MKESPLPNPPPAGSRAKPPGRVPMEPVYEMGDDVETFPEVDPPAEPDPIRIISAGKPLYHRMPQEASLSAWGCFGLAAVLGVACIIARVVIFPSEPVHNYDDDAISVARVAVLSGLTNPHDAEFQPGVTCQRTTLPAVGNATCFAVRGLVKVVNGFGARLTREFRAKLVIVKGEMRCIVAMLEEDVIYADDELVKQFTPR